VADGALVVGRADHARQRTELLKDVVDGFHEPGSVAGQAMAAATGHAIRRAE
jgi:hypothetical protein